MDAENICDLCKKKHPKVESIVYEDAFQKRILTVCSPRCFMDYLIAGVHEIGHAIQTVRKYIP